MAVSQLSEESLISFLKGFDQLYVANKTSSSFDLTLSDLIIHFCCLQSILTSRFVEFVVSNNVVLNVPHYVHVLLTKVVIKTESENKATGWSIGTTISSCQLLGLLRFYKSVFESSDNAYPILHDTCFAHILTSKRAYSKFQSVFDMRISSLINEVESLTSNDEIFRVVLAQLSTINTSSLHGKVPMFSGKLNFSTSSHLNMYRFRNSGFEDVFVCNQHALTAINVETVNLFAVALKILKPVFLHGEQRINTISLLPGDGKISIENYTLESSWIKLLSFCPLKGSTSSSNDTASGNTSLTGLPSSSSSRSSTGVRGMSTLSRLRGFPKPKSGFSNLKDVLKANNLTTSDIIITQGDGPDNCLVYFSPLSSREKFFDFIPEYEHDMFG
jgi:hypothetical protein